MDPKHENRLAFSIETPRLELRPFSRTDISAFHAMNQDPNVRRFIGGAPLSMEFCEAHIDRCRVNWATRGYSQCAVVRRLDGRLIGRGGINPLDELASLEVSWVVAQSEWGRGYATEAARAAVAFAFDELGVERLSAPIHPENRASMRVAEKVGMRPREHVDVYGDGVMLIHYVLEVDEWKSLREALGSDIVFRYA